MKTLKIPIKILEKTPNKLKLNDRKIKDIYELIDELEIMTEENYKENEQTIANWIENELTEKTLADEIRQTNNKKETQRAILKHIVRITKDQQKQPIENLKELVARIKQINQKTYKEYVNEQKNDIADLIQYTLQDKKLATLARTTQNKQRLTAILERAIEKPIQKREQTIQTPTIIKTQKITTLLLTEHGQKHHTIIQTASYLTLGIVAGAAIAILMLALA